MTKRIAKNIYGNWVGYVGTKRVKEFGCDCCAEQDAKDWMVSEAVELVPEVSSRVRLTRGK